MLVRAKVLVELVRRLPAQRPQELRAHRGPRVLASKLRELESYAHAPQVLGHDLRRAQYHYSLRHQVPRRFIQQRARVPVRVLSRLGHVCPLLGQYGVAAVQIAYHMLCTDPMDLSSR